jgi:hypothetical protein
MGLYERRQCARRGCRREFIPRSRRQKYCNVHKWRKPRDPLHSVKYGPAHRRLRAHWTARVVAGVVRCARCGEPIGPCEAWDLGHADEGGLRAYSGPEHARCNRATNDGRSVSRIW